MSNKLTHIDEHGSAHMVDVANKQTTTRLAIAEGKIIMLPKTLKTIEAGHILKGDVLAAARIAGIMAAKQTAHLIPLCHPLLLNKVAVDIQPDPNLPGFVIRATVKVDGVTGVEMEALTAVSIACLTIYDMAKATDKNMTICDIKLIEKQGGKSGLWQKQDS